MDAPHIITHRSEVVPDIAETLTAWVVPTVRDRQSFTMHGKDCRCEAVHDTKAGSLPVSEKRLYAGTEGKVPREGSCGHCAWSYESDGSTVVTAHAHSPRLGGTFSVLRIRLDDIGGFAAAEELAGILRKPPEGGIVDL